VQSERFGSFGGPAMGGFDMNKNTANQAFNLNKKSQLGQ
jgi:hypothetical protein